MRDAVLENARPQNGRASNASNDLWEAHHDDWMTASKPSISALCSVDDHSNAKLINARSSVTADLVGAAVRRSLKRSAATAVERSSSHLYLVVQCHHHVDILATD